MVTVKVADPELPAASLAVAVHTLVVFSVTVAAVNVVSEKAPLFVQVTFGPEVTLTLSVAVTVEVPVSPDDTVNVAGLNETDGGAVSTTGGVTLPPPLLPLPLPPQADKVSAHIADSV